MNVDFSFIVFAAGRGIRAGLSVPKVLAPLGAHPILYYTLRAIADCHPTSITVVIGHEGAIVSDVVRSTLEPYSCSWSVVEQRPLLGTGHAIAVAVDHLALQPETQRIICLNGDDSALLTPQALCSVMSAHRHSVDELSMVVTDVDDTLPFGRVRAIPPSVVEFLAYRECVTRALLPLPIVTGIYAFKTSWLRQNVDCFYPDRRGELPIYQLVYRARDSMTRWGVIQLPTENWGSANTPAEFEALRARFIRMRGE